MNPAQRRRFTRAGLKSMKMQKMMVSRAEQRSMIETMDRLSVRIVENIGEMAHQLLARGVPLDEVIRTSAILLDLSLPDERLGERLLRSFDVSR